jgi:hypothetical protein
MCGFALSLAIVVALRVVPLSFKAQQAVPIQAK